MKTLCSSRDWWLVRHDPSRQPTATSLRNPISSHSARPTQLTLQLLSLSVIIFLSLHLPSCRAEVNRTNSITGGHRWTLLTSSPVCTPHDTLSAINVCHVNESPDIIKVGYLTNMHGRHSKTRQGLVISGAIKYAIDHVNNDLPGLLNGRRLQLLYQDTSGNAINSTTAMLSMWQRGAIAFFGPEDTCEVEATVATALNLPMISYKCANSKVSDKNLYRTFARTHPPDSVVVESLLELLKYYSWRKFGLIWHNSEKYSPVVHTLRSRIGSNFTITTEYAFEDTNQCCLLHNRCCYQHWSDVVEATYQDARIYVFLAGSTFLPNFLLALKTRGLLESGDYLVISVELEEEYQEDQAYRFINQRTDLPEHEIEAINDAARSLLIVARTPPHSTNYGQFVDKVRQYNKQPPFNLSDRMDMKRHITYYAAYLYDAVILYAKALSLVLQNNGSLTDGYQIIQTILSNFTEYESVTGARITFNPETGDALGNYTVLQPIFDVVNRSRRSFDTKLHTLKQLRGVGRFSITVNKSNYSIEYVPTNKVIWPRGAHIPAEEPPCGFDGKGCGENETRVRELLLGVLTAIFLATIMVTTLTYRGWKYEQEIDGLLWKISTEDILFDDDRARILTASRASIMSTSSETKARQKDWDFGIKLATYKGALVAVKEFRFAKPKKSNTSSPYDYLSRDNKKEMKYVRDMHHKNINPFIGVCEHPQHPCSVFLVTEYCSKGSLRDVLENDEIKLDESFLSSLIFDIISALSYLHKSELKCHGNLKSTNCLITSRWVLKLTDFGLHQLRATAETDSSKDIIDNYNLLWRAPEQLRNGGAKPGPECDIYSFGIIIHEMVVRQGPFAIKSLPEDKFKNELSAIVEGVKFGPPEGGTARRPNLVDVELNDDIIDIMNSCWHEESKERPGIDTLRTRFKTCQKFKPRSGNIVDNMMEMMEVYQNQLEDLVLKRTQQLYEEKRRTELLLHRMLPESVAKQLIHGGNVVPESFESVTIYFSDIVGFTRLSAESTPMEVVTFLNDLYTIFDSIISHYQVYKVETIGDAYMVVSGLPIRHENHATEIASMALEMLEAVKSFKIRHRSEETLQLRIGVHTGPVVAGVVGLKMPRYCLFGDTVNTASRMESNGEALKVHISPECKAYLEPSNQYIIKERGMVYMKGKGEIRTFWLCGHVDGPRNRLSNHENACVDSPWITSDKSKAAQISLFDEPGDRKGSLVTFEQQPNMSLYKKSLLAGGMAASLARLKSTYSNSFSTLRHQQAETRTSPKPSKRNWPLSFISGKFRSNSTNQPDSSPSNHIVLKETNRTAKNIIKSPSYNMIESLGTRPNGRDHSVDHRDSSAKRYDNIKKPASSNTVESFIEESNIDESSTGNRTDEHDLNVDEFGEDRPLLSKSYRAVNVGSPRHEHLARQSSLAEVDEDLFRREEGGSSEDYLKLNIDDGSGVPNHSGVDSTAKAKSALLDRYLSTLSESSPNHQASHHAHYSPSNEHVHLDLSPSSTDQFYFDNKVPPTNNGSAKGPLKTTL